MPNPKHATAIVEFNHCYLKDAFTVPNAKRLRVKILRVHEHDGRLHVWASVRGPKSGLRRLQRRLAGLRGSSYVVMNNSPDSRLLYVTLPSLHCPKRDKCPIANPSGKSFVQAAVIEDGRMLALVFSSSLKSLRDLQENTDLEVLEVFDTDEYVELTPNQEEVLLLAVELGYYSYPRRISLRELADALGLSVSALAERLRKAEAKIMRKTVDEELRLTIYLRNKERDWEKNGKE